MSSSKNSYIGTCLLLVLLAGQILSARALNEYPRNEELVNALAEMQSANYFAFVILIKMLLDRIPGNTTFLMPHDRMLSNVAIPENTVYEFLMRHSIPVPLLFDHLEHFPTGSIIPTHESGVVLRVFNGGRRRFCLNNVRIISPNICTCGSSIRCHGIDGVLSIPGSEHNNTPSSPSYCSASSPPIAPASATTPPTPQKSESSLQLNVGLFGTLAYCFILSLFKFQI